MAALMAPPASPEFTSHRCYWARDIRVPIVLMMRTTGVNKACLGEGRLKVAHVPIMCPGRSEHASNSLKMLGKDWQRLVIPTAPNIDSLRDSQIRESLTRCWLLKEEQHRWVQRLRSDGLI